MQVEVRRSGGITGLCRTWQVPVEQTPDPAGLRRLIDACPWDDPPCATGPARPDRFVYRFAAGDRTATVPEAALAGPWRALFERVRDLSRTVE